MYTFEAPPNKLISEDIEGVFKNDVNIEVKYADYKIPTLVLHKYNGTTENITIKENDKWKDVLSKIRTSETRLKSNEKFICWASREFNKKWLENRDVAYLYNIEIYDSKFDEIMQGFYDNVRIYSGKQKDDKVNLYEVVTEKENHVVIDATVVEYRNRTISHDYALHLNNIYVIKPVANLDYRGIIKIIENRNSGKWSIPRSKEKYYDIDINNLNNIKDLNLDEKILKDNIIGFKEIDVNDRNINGQHTFYVYSDPKLDYENETNPTLDLTHMVVAIVDGNTRKLVPFEKFEEYKITAEPKNETLLTFDDNEKSIKVTMAGDPEKFAFTLNSLKLTNDGFNVDDFSISLKYEPQLEYKIYKKPSDTKLNLNDLVLTLTSDSTIKPNEKVSRNIPYEDLKQYGIEIKMNNDVVDNETVLNLSDDKKTLVAYKGTTGCEVGTLEVKDGIFREEKTKEINVKTSPKTQPKTKYIVGENIDLNDIVLEFTDSNGNTKDYGYQALLEKGFTFSLCGKDFVVKQPETPVEPEQP